MRGITKLFHCRTEVQKIYFKQGIHSRCGKPNRGFRRIFVFVIMVAFTEWGNEALAMWSIVDFKMGARVVLVPHDARHTSCEITLSH